ncbi:MAG: cupin-like domain-containing protein [Cyclobacteriaceae bacterium]
MKVERIDQIPDHQTFYNLYIATGQPVIIQNQISADNLKHWTPDSLKSIIGDVEVTVNSAPDGRYVIDSETGVVIAKQEDISFSDYIDRLEAGNEYLNLQHWPLLNIIETLKENCWQSEFLNEEILDAERIWIGAKDTITSLHYDTFNNFIVQYYGRKKVTLFHADQLDKLYCHPLNTKSPHLSQVNIKEPDLDLYPDFKKADFAEVILEPGDILFMPSCCFHQIENLDLSISVAIWWDNYIDQLLHPGITRFAHTFYDDIPLQYSQLIGVGAYDSIIEFSEHAWKEGNLRLASVLGCAALELQIRYHYLINCGGDDEISDMKLDANIALDILDRLKESDNLSADRYEVCKELINHKFKFDTVDDAYFTPEMATAYTQVARGFERENKSVNA